MLLRVLVTHPECALSWLDLSGAPPRHAAGALLPTLLMQLASCASLTHLDVSGHAAGDAPGVLGALLHVLRTATRLQALHIYANGLAPSALRALLGGWRRRNLTLIELRLFANDPRDAGGAGVGAGGGGVGGGVGGGGGGGGFGALTHELASPRLAAELLDEADALSTRNQRIAAALAEGRADARAPAPARGAPPSDGVGARQPQSRSSSPVTP